MAAVVIGVRRRRETEQARAKRRESDEDGRFFGSGRRISMGTVSERVSQTLSKTVTVIAAPDGKGWRKYQPQAYNLYTHNNVQVGVAGLIVLNFLVNICQAQIDPKGKDSDGVFYAWDVFFNVVFLIELLLNMYSVWFRKFWQSSWNIFDFLVVTIGWLFQLNVPLPGPMKLLRMMRAFRVFRLFKRVKSLAKIMGALANAVPGVMNAFLIQAIVTCIFAIIAVDRFGDYGEGPDGARGEGGFMINEMDQRVDLMTGRETTYGFNYFGCFGKSLFTIFQAVTEESWVEAIARPLLNSNSPTTSTGAAFFFVFNNVLNTVVLMNVVVAVLLEKMIPNENDEPHEENDEPDKVPEPNSHDGGDAVVVVRERPPSLDERIMSTVEAVQKLKKQMDDFTELICQLHGQLADVDEIRVMVAAVLAHQEVTLKPILAKQEFMVKPDAALASREATSNGHTMRLASFETAGDIVDARAQLQVSPWPTPQASPMAAVVHQGIDPAAPAPASQGWVKGVVVNEPPSPNGPEPPSPCLPNQIEETS